MIKENLKTVQEHIKESIAKRHNAASEDVLLVAVTKNHDVASMQEAIDAGANVIGENRVQEALQKHETLNRDVTWHLIGHLQTNKAKYAVKEDDSVVIEIPAPKLLEVIPQDIPIDIVYEDDKVLAFNDRNPVAPYHILVVPKKHYESILDVNAEDMDIMSHIHKVINIIANEKGFAQNGFRIINNCGEDGGQEVKHIHYHVLAGKKLPNYEAEEK